MEKRTENTYIVTVYKCTFKKARHAEVIKFQLDITLENRYNEVVTKVCGYTSGTNMLFEDMHTFRMFF